MRPKIVVLDGYTLAPADQDQSSRDESPPLAANDNSINWNALAQLGDVTLYDRSRQDQVIDRAIDADIVLTNKIPLSAKTISQLPALKYIGVTATGVNNVDLKAAGQCEIVVTNVPAYSTHSVAQHVFALLLELTNKISQHSRAVQTNQWTQCEDFSLTVSTITELAGKTLGIIGMGAIGQRVAQIGSALGLHVAAAHQSSEANVHLRMPIRWLTLDQLVAQADILTLHCPLTDRTHHIINISRLEKMKPSAILINTARGALIDEVALAEALRQDQIAAAALDVLNQEPPTADNPLLTAPNCLITPHIAWASRESKQRLINRATENVKAFLEGSPINVVASVRLEKPEPTPTGQVPPSGPAQAIKPTPKTRSLLLLAAMEEEIKPTITRLGLKPDNMVHSGQIGSFKIIAAVTGTGQARAIAATNRLLDETKAEAVFLLGFAGGLDPSLPAGDVLSVSWIIDERGWAIHLDHEIDARENQLFPPPSVQLLDESQRRTTEQSLLTIDRIADSVAVKRQLFKRYGCAAVDMETYHVANVLAERGVPLMILRAISDPADMTLPAASVNWIKSDGKANVPAVMRHLLINPLRTTHLMRLAKNTRLAAEQLALQVEAKVRAITQ